MKYLFVFFLMVFSLNCYAEEQGATYSTTAKLPNDKMIWPLPKLDVTENILAVNAEFIGAPEVLSVVQGNYRQIVYMVKYKVIEPHKGYPYKNIVFMVKDSWPTAESGIRAKRRPFQFRAGSKTFFMEKDRSCKYTGYFNIITYRQFND